MTSKVITRRRRREDWEEDEEEDDHNEEAVEDGDCYSCAELKLRPSS